MEAFDRANAPTWDLKYNRNDQAVLFVQVQDERSGVGFWGSVYLVPQGSQGG